ncbi:12448_t:CDS:2 [Entrophospora sp. SA101]
MDVSTVLTPPSSPICALQHYECAVCKILYKTKSGLTHHNTIVQKYNLQHEGLCRLPSDVITEFKAFLVHVIQSKLKEHFSQLSRQAISFPCLESLFFGVFEG